MLYQQGDVLIETVTEIPKDAKPRKDKVLFYGEASGHAHRVTGDAQVVEILSSPWMLESDELFISAPTPTEVVHEEHKVIKLPAGKYRVRKVREYDHFDKAVRDVMD